LSSTPCESPSEEQQPSTPRAVSELSPEEQERIQDLIRLVPRGQATALEIGARDGRVTRLLAEHFEHVTALDLEKPVFTLDRVTPVKGDARYLKFPDRSFDCVFCTEVLEHIPGVGQAACEIARVARRYIVIGVPFRQDTRVMRTTCRACGKINPPWGHVNTFDEEVLRQLFPDWIAAATSLVGTNNDRATALSTWLQDRGGNPYGAYDQAEPCIQCGQKVLAPDSSGLIGKVCVAAGLRLQNLRGRLSNPWPNWIHLVLARQ
jgi:hypothetical protein